MRTWIIVVVVFWGEIIFAQSNDFVRYGVENGLAGPQVNVIKEDSLGYLWVGTSGGLSVFDGNRFNSFKHATELQEPILDIAFVNQYAWVLLENEIVRVIHESTKSYPYKGNNSLSKLIHVTADSLVIFSTNGRYSSVYNDSVAWDVGVIEHFINAFPFSDGILLETTDSLIFNSGTESCKLFKPAYFGKIYKTFSGDLNHLITTSTGTFQIKNRKLTSVSSLPPYTEVINTTDSILWFSKPASGIFRTKPRRSSEFFGNWLVTCSMLDKEGIIWLGHSGGLLKYSRSLFKPFLHQDLKVGALSGEENELWIGSYGDGIIHVSDGQIIGEYKTNNPAKNIIRSIAHSNKKDTIWLGTFGGLGLFRPSTKSTTWLTRVNGLSSDSIYTLELGKDSELWIGTHHGLLMYDAKTISRYEIPVYGIKYSVQSILSLNGSLLVGTDKGLFTLKNNKLVKADWFKENHNVVAIVFLNKHLIVATNKTIYIFNSELNRINFLDAMHGLLSNHIYSMAIEDEHLWVAGDRGLNRIKFNNDFFIQANQEFDPSIGYKGIEIDLFSFYKFNKQRLIGSSSGVYIFEDPHHKALKYFNPHLVSIKFFHGEKDSILDKSFLDALHSYRRGAGQATFPNDLNHITFEYGCVNKMYSKQISYQYFLEGFDPGWSPFKTTNTVTYSNLPFGEFRFMVRARIGDTILPNEVLYSFSIDPPFYLRPYAFAAISLAITLLVLGVFYLWSRIKIRQVVALSNIRAEEQRLMRKEISRDFHDEMGNQIAKILNYVSLFQFRKNTSVNKNELLTKIELAAKSLHRNTKDFIWSIDPSNDELSEVFLYIRDFGVKLFDEQIAFKAKNELTKSIPIRYGYGREIIFIFKEAMTNTIKHANAREVIFSLNIESNKAIISFWDDGVGFPTSKTNRRGGIENMKIRANKINSELSIKNHKGTTVALELTI